MEDINIYEIIRIESLPLRTLNICKKLGINSLSDILNYFNINKTFAKLGICGKKTNQDLINVYYKYSNGTGRNIIKNDFNNSQFVNDENLFNTINLKSTLNKINKLSSSQKTIINNKIALKAGNLSERGSNAIKYLLHGKYTIENLSTYVFSYKYFNFLKVRNVGKNTLPELNQFIIEILDEIDKVIKLNKTKNSIDNFQINNEFALSTLQNLFSFREDYFELISSDYSKNKTFPVFKMIDILINKGYIYNKNELLVFNNATNCTTYENNDIHEISKIAGLTCERIRQIKLIVLNNFEATFSFIKKFEKLVQYDFFNISKHYINIDDETTEYLNFKENVHFSKFFYIKIFSVIADNTHSLIGNISINITEPKIKKIVNQEYCLVSRHFSDIFDFNSFIKDIYQQIYKRKTKTISRNFINYISGFYYKDNHAGIHVISEICKKILYNNFSIVPDNYSNINFERNTKKLTYEYLIDILEEFKRPMHFVELYKECVKREYPVKSDMGVHSTLINHSEIFGLKGAGTFNLRKSGGYFGTIGNVAERYLKEKNHPVSLNELEKFINGELIISKYSIRMVLFKYKNENRFILDNNNMVSLKEW